MNVSFGNACYTTAFSKCFTLSITTFLIIYTPFEIYWSFRDLWYDRWKKLFLKDLNISNLKIEITNGFLATDIVKSRNEIKNNLKNALIIICHGFSDTKRKLQYLYFPLALQGYTILIYDARGTGKSKKTGKRSEFIKRIEDFKEILKWVKNQKEFKTKKIFCIGFSIGAITVLSGGLLNDNIEKIIAISSISNYRRNIPKYNPIVLLSYLFKGVKLFPNPEENYRLSPYLFIRKAKENLEFDQWNRLSRKVMLIHCKNDRVIKYINLKENKMILEPPRKNLVVLKRGGHSHKKNELILVGAILNFLNS